MDFDLSPEHAALQAAARQFVDRECPPRQAKEWDEANAYPAELFKAMANIGWFGLAFPDEAGGDGGGAMELTSDRGAARPGQPRHRHVLHRHPDPRAHRLPVGLRRAAPRHRRHDVHR